MFPIHCNKCFKRRELDLEVSYQLTRCHHIVCDNCINSVAKESNSGSTQSHNKLCPVCKRPFQGIAITRNLPSNVAHYFQDPRQFLNLYKKISKFQSEQKVSYVHYFQRQQSEVPDLQRKLNGYIKLEERLREQRDKEQKQIEALQNYISFYERNDELQNKTHNSTGTISSSSSRISAPVTPVLSDLVPDELELMQRSSSRGSSTNTHRSNTKVAKTVRRKPGDHDL